MRMWITINVSLPTNNMKIKHNYLLNHIIDHAEFEYSSSQIEVDDTRGRPTVH